MIISAKLHYNSKTKLHCCLCHKLIDIPYLALFGYAEKPDPPYTIYKCIRCEMQKGCGGELLKLSYSDHRNIVMWWEDEQKRLDTFKNAAIAMDVLR